MKLQKWGNSAAIRIPKDMLCTLGLQVGDELEMLVNGHSIVIRATTRPRYHLADLLAEMSNGEQMRVDGWEDMENVGLELPESK